jgi:DNA-binding NtrC family response regulator
VREAGSRPQTIEAFDLDHHPHSQDPHLPTTADSPSEETPEPLVPDERIPLLDSHGEFSCPHCNGTIRLQGVGLRFEGSDEAETVQLDLRHPDEALDEVVDDVRRVLVIRALREADGVKVKAAEIAGMKYTTFYELVRRLDITDEEINA